MDGSVSVVAEDVRLTNGLGFSPDDKRLYHNDSLRRQVCVYDVKEDGSLGPKKVFAETEKGVPDGLVVSEDGAVWVALAEAVLVLRYLSQLELRESFKYLTLCARVFVLVAKT